MSGRMPLVSRAESLVRVALSASGVLVFAACTLQSHVTISPLTVTADPTVRTKSVKELVGDGHYTHALSAGETSARSSYHAAEEIAALGAAAAACGRYEEARRHLLNAYEARPERLTLATVAWDLSQAEYMSNNFAGALHWARIAARHGLVIRQWHLDLLDALRGEVAYRVEGASSVNLRIAHTSPDVPRLESRINGAGTALTVIDSGAVMTIVSDAAADRLEIKRLGTFEGTFFGLLGEPIQVKFGLIERLELGEMVIRNVPAAIMPGKTMRFLSKKQQPFQIDVLLGTHLLKEFRLEFDFRKDSLVLTYLSPSERIPVSDQNLFILGSRPIVHSATNRRGWFLFLLDTGSEITFLNDLPQSNAVLAQMPKFYSAKLQGLGGAVRRGVKVAGVEIGIDQWSGTFRELPLYQSDTQNILGIIGQDFLKNFKVTIDFGRMRVDLRR